MRGKKAGEIAESDGVVQASVLTNVNTGKVVLPRSKKTATMPIDADLLEWFRRNSGYQNRINAALRAYMNAQAGPR